MLLSAGDVIVLLVAFLALRWRRRLRREDVEEVEEDDSVSVSVSELTCEKIVRNQLKKKYTGICCRRVGA